MKRLGAATCMQLVQRLYMHNGFQFAIVPLLVFAGGAHSVFAVAGYKNQELLAAFFERDVLRVGAG